MRLWPVTWRRRPFDAVAAFFEAWAGELVMFPDFLTAMPVSFDLSRSYG
jgi:hypothetical protein